MEEGGIWELRSYLYRLWGVGGGGVPHPFGGVGVRWGRGQPI